MKKISLVTLGLASLMAIPFASCNKERGRNGIIEDDIDMFPVQISKDKWSFVNSKGDIFFEDDFKNQPTLVYNHVFSVEEKNGKYTTYKVSGDSYDVLGELEGLYSVGCLQEGLIPASLPDKRIRVYNGSGEELFEIKSVSGSEILASHPCYSDGLLAVMNSDGDWGYINKEGEPVIKPSYSDVGVFVNGLAVVEKTDDKSGDVSYKVIDKEGETVFKLKDGQEPNVLMFDHGYLITNDGDKAVLYDRKGEAVKFPSKFKGIVQTDGKYVVFYDEDYNFGIANMEGEVIIKAKYDGMLIDGGEFLAKEDKEVIRLDKNGKEKMVYDYLNLYEAGKFGFFAADKKHYYLINKKGEEKCSEYFREVGNSVSPEGNVYSDYKKKKLTAVLHR